MLELTEQVADGNGGYFQFLCARHRSFAHAAAELDVTPPAVAHRIRMLESHLGAELFERGRRSVRLNRRGRAYYEEVRRILLDIRETTERHGDRRRFRGR